MRLPPGGLGGAMGLRLPTSTQHAAFPTSCTAFATARSALGAIARRTEAQRVHAPHWICDTALAAFREAGLPIHFYRLDDQLRPVGAPLDDTAALTILVDYFGITPLPSAAGPHLVVDATQAYDRPADPTRWTVTSARKFFGVPDGATACGPLSLPAPSTRADHTLHHLALRAMGDAGSLAASRRHEAGLGTAPLGPSAITEAILSRVDLAADRHARRSNFQRMHARLGPTNRLSPALGPSMPLAYPYLPPVPIPRAHFFAAKVWVPRYWAERQDSPDPWTVELSQALRPLPIDPRLSADHVDYICDVVEAGLRGQVQ